ncbi:MAG: hypothetical protein K5930_04000 [Treponemataceae bacterium]|nr:hypothetical protein [Treponemataceae bacterium]
MSVSDEVTRINAAERRGRKEGLAEGERKKTVEAVRSFYKNGVSVEIIAQSLNMPLDEVNKIIGK